MESNMKSGTVISKNTKSGGNPLLNHKKLQLTDFSRRDAEPGYIHTFAFIPYDVFPKDSNELANEVKRLKDEMRNKNITWKKSHMGVAPPSMPTSFQKEGQNGGQNVASLGTPMQAKDNIAGDVDIAMFEKNINLNDRITSHRANFLKEPVIPQYLTQMVNQGQNVARQTQGQNQAMRPEIPKYTATATLKLDANTGNTVFICASSKAGKTTLQMYLYKKYFAKSIAIMFAHNPQLKIYKQKNLIVTDNFQPDIIEIMRRLNRISKNKFDFTILLDDQIKVKTDAIQDMMLSLRNSNISSIVSLQYINLLSKACRGNVNNVLLGSLNSDENILVAIKCYLMSFMHSAFKTSFQKEGQNIAQNRTVTEPEMIAYYRELTSDHGFINIHPASGEIKFIRLAF